MKQYIDKGLFMNPLFDYFKWIKCKVYYQLRNWGKHLRISYKTIVSGTVFGRYNWLGRYSQIYNCNFGDFSYCGDNCSISNANIGKFCSIGPNVRIAPGKHPSSTHISTHPATFNNQPNFLKSFIGRDTYKSFEEVTIGNDVWIGANCLIVDGVSIGHGSIIAANSVVNKNVGDYELVGGVPAKLIKKRFKDEDIDNLLKIKWWDKGDEWIQRNIEQFSSVEEFIDEHKII
ncbi:CatB-related O-acetyltransferase [Mucilaginibacter sp. AW1-3]